MLHLDESRPHIHAAIIPHDRQEHLSYKVYFNGRQNSGTCRSTSHGALEGLGVEEYSDLVTAACVAQYTLGIDGWRFGHIVQEIATWEKALATGLEQEAAAAQHLGSLPAAKRGESARRYRRRVSPVIHAQIRARGADRKRPLETGNAHCRRDWGSWNA